VFSVFTLTNPFSTWKNPVLQQQTKSLQSLKSQGFTKTVSMYNCLTLTVTTVLWKNDRTIQIKSRGRAKQKRYGKYKS